MEHVIYKKEIDDGLADAIKSAKATCSFLIEEVGSFNIEKSDIPEYFIGKASIENPDLFCFKSINVSTGMNKNGQYFLPEELWKAKATIPNKRINYEHEEADIIGCDLKYYVLDKSGNLVDESLKIEEIPDFIDIATESVLYRVWSDEKLQKRMDRIISSIKAGDMFVSMEALYPDFDYVLIDDDGNEEFIKRNSKNSHMTKHAIVYGGKGVYNGKKLGIVLKNIMFHGKAVTKRPANPRSIILEVDNTETNIKISNKAKSSIEDVYLKKEVKEMDEYKDKFDSLQKELDSVKASYEQKVNDLGKNVSELAVANTQLNEKLKAETETFTVKVKGLEDSVAQKNTELEKALANIADLTKSLDEYKVKERDLNRVKKVKTELELDEAEASEYVAKFSEFNDSAFDLVVATQKSSVKKPQPVSGLNAPMGDGPKKVSVKDVVKAKASLEDVKPEANINVSVAADQTKTTPKDVAVGQILAAFKK